MNSEQGCIRSHRASETGRTELAGGVTPLPATGQDHPEAHVSASASSGVLFWRKAGKDCLEKKWALQPETGDGGLPWWSSG